MQDLTMQDLKVTLVQANQIWENKEANFKNYERLLLNTEPTDLIVLPEMFNTGFSLNAKNLAEPFETSDSIKWLKELAKVQDAAIYTSLIIFADHCFFNRGVFVFPTGDLEFYDKRKTFGLAGENKEFTSGKSPKIVLYKGWKINLQICYDLRFPEICLNSIENNETIYDLMIYVANWPEKRISHWNSLLPARAIENQAYVIGLNRVGTDNSKLAYNGQSQIVDALGETKNLGNLEAAFSLNLRSNALAETRAMLPFLKDRNVKF